MKKLMLLAITFVSVQSFAQKIEMPPVYEDPRELVTRSVPEDSMLYFKLGQTVGRENGNPVDYNLGSFGYLRYAENFIYGLEYSSYYTSRESTRVTNLQVVVGHRVIWNKRFLPYGIIQFGPSKFKKEEPTSVTGSGIATTFDTGFDTFRYKKLKVSIGVRHTISGFNKPELSGANFTDLYVMTGWVW